METTNYIINKNLIPIYRPENIKILVEDQVISGLWDDEFFGFSPVGFIQFRLHAFSKSIPFLLELVKSKKYITVKINSLDSGLEWLNEEVYGSLSMDVFGGIELPMVVISVCKQGKNYNEQNNNRTSR